jgi:hypothetical protein
MQIVVQAMEGWMSLVVGAVRKRGRRRRRREV